MTKEKSAPDGQETVFDLTLDEFCSRLSQTDKRVELIGGFYHSEKVAGRVKDSEASFQARFEKFINQPA